MVGDDRNDASPQVKSDRCESTLAPDTKSRKSRSSCSLVFLVSLVYFAALGCEIYIERSGTDSNVSLFSLLALIVTLSACGPVLAVIAVIRTASGRLGGVACFCLIVLAGFYFLLWPIVGLLTSRAVNKILEGDEFQTASLR